MRVVVAGLQPVFCEGLRCILTSVSESEEVSVVSGKGALDHINTDADLFLIDAGGVSDLALLEVLCRPLIDAGHKVVLFTDVEHPSRVREMIVNINVNGIVPKTLDVNLVLSVVKLVISGGRYVPEAVLASRSMGFAEPMGSFSVGRRGFDDSGRYVGLTPRQRDVLLQLGKGKSNKEIADALKISVATVKLHVNAVLQALNVNNRTGAAILALQYMDQDKNEIDIPVAMRTRRTPSTEAQRLSERKEEDNQATVQEAPAKEVVT